MNAPSYLNYWSNDVIQYFFLIIMYNNKSSDIVASLYLIESVRKLEIWLRKVFSKIPGQDKLIID